MNPIKFTVHGLPAPQGSKRHVGGGRLIESSKKVAPWRKAIVDQCAIEGITGRNIDGPVDIYVCFFMPRPKSHHNSRGEIKATAPKNPHRVPDLDKLLRSTFDALTTANVWEDDARVVSVEAVKVYALDGIPTGAHIQITALERTTP